MGSETDHVCLITRIQYVTGNACCNFYTASSVKYLRLFLYWPSDVGLQCLNHPTGPCFSYLCLGTVGNHFFITKGSLWYLNSTLWHSTVPGTTGPVGQLSTCHFIPELYLVFYLQTTKYMYVHC